MSTSASAEPIEEFGARGQVTLSADRLVPLFSYSKTTTDANNGDSSTESTSSIALLWTSGPQDFYDVPRLGLDYSVTSNITLGGNLFFTLPLSHSQSQTRNNTTTTTDEATTNAFGIGVRGGYIASIAPKISFWGRLGLSYTREGTTTPQQVGNDVHSSLSQVALAIEPLFVIHLTSHLGFTVGPVIDVPLSGNLHQELVIGNMTVSSDNASSQFHFGISGGLIGWL